MKKRMKRLAAMLLLGCMVAGSVPGGLVYAKESALVSDLTEDTETGDVQEAEDDQIPGNDVEEAENEQTSENDVEEAEDDQTSGNDVQEAEDDQITESDVQEADDDRASEGDVQETDDADKLQEFDGKGADAQNEEAIEEQTSENSIIEKNADAINYVIVESPYLETPGTERIAVSYGDGSENISDATLTVRDDEGQETIWDLRVSVDQLYLFTYEYTDESETGTYEVISLNVTDDTGEKAVLLSESGMEANFGVNEEYSGIEELQPLDVETAKSRTADEATDIEATVAEIDPDNVEESTEQIVNALENAEEQTEGAAGSSAGISTFAATMGAKAKVAAAKSDNGNIVVALDPGHDSTHAGASSNGLREEVLTLKIANYCKEELEKYAGVTVYMTRTGASCPHPGGSSGRDIGERVNAAADAGADIYVSLHLNSSTASSVNGSEVIIPNESWKPQLAEEGEELAKAILKELEAIGLNMRPDEIYSKDTTINERYPDGSISDYFSVQIYAKERGIPGIIVEHAFITNSGDRNYLNSESGLKKLGVADATGIAKYLGLDKGKWVTDTQGNKFYYVNNKKIIGKKKINGYWYYFDPQKDGAMYVGWRQDDAMKYYYDTDGKLTLGTKKIDGYWYYFQSNGDMYTGWRQDGTMRYYYDSNGRLALGKKEIDGYQYYFQSNGNVYIGWYQENDKQYYYDADGKLTVGVKKIDGFWYYFDTDGSMYTGWRQDGAMKYYYDTDGKLTLGTKKIGGYWYYFQSNGDMYTGWRQDGAMRYYYDSNGRLALGKKEIDGYQYYFQSNGNVYTGWYRKDDKQYYYDADGKLTVGVKKIDGFWYYFDTDGSMYTGWRQDGVMKYYYDTDGKLTLGTKKIDGYWYYFQSNGDMYTGWRQDGAMRYYYDSNGRLALGKKEIDGYQYYFQSNGNMYTGWREDGTKRYYYDAEGKLALGTKKIEGYWYYFQNNGDMYTGWRNDGSYIYYYDSEGKLALGETIIGNSTYYFQSDGNMLKNDFADRKYYGTDGKMIPVSEYGSVFYKIEGKTTTTIEQMVRFYEKSGDIYPSEELGKGGAETIEEFAEIFYEEANAEGIKAEVLWAQTMFETGYLKFGGQVKIEQFNFAGIGAMDDGTAGASFADVRTGVRAQVQHMKAYASTEALKNVCVDPRFDLVTRGSAQYVETLGQKENPTGAGWATTQNYGVNLMKLVKKINNV